MKEGVNLSMKVLHVINIGGYGGAEKLLLQLLPGLNNKITADCLICCRKGIDVAGKKIGEELEKKGVVVYYLFYERIVSKNIFREIVQVVNKGNYDLIHSHLKYANLWMAILKWRRKINIPVITTLHGYRDSYQNKYGLLFRKKTVFTLYYHTSKWIFKRLDGFIIISKCLKDFFEDSRLLEGRGVKIIYHGYEIPADNSGGTVRPGVLMNPEIAIPGRLIRLKGHSYAIRVVKELLDKNRRAILHIYGAGPEEGAIRQLVSKYGLNSNVIFHGYVHDLLNRLKQCDIVLIPSLYESFGLVFLDAFAAGVPAVAFDLPAGNEIITHEYNGLLARPYDHGSLYEEVVKLCDSEDLRKSLIANAKMALQGPFSIERMIGDYIGYYNCFPARNK